MSEELRRRIREEFEVVSELAWRADIRSAMLVVEPLFTRLAEAERLLARATFSGPAYLETDWKNRHRAFLNAGRKEQNDAD